MAESRSSRANPSTTSPKTVGGPVGEADRANRVHVAPGSSAAIGHTPHHHPTQETVKDTLISVIIAFALAFVFRGFVIEAFVIPTGSMAPTLMGTHMKFHGVETGYDWAVDPWQVGNPDPSQYPSPQHDIAVNDPISGDAIRAKQVPLHAGDRILVLKYLYSIQEPQRYDVVVFKNPTDPSQNYIKRLIGLAGEEIALVDGDVFVRRPEDRPQPPASPADAKSIWEQPGWKIARKPALQQRAVWQTVYDAAYAPFNSGPTRTPFTPDDPAGWTIDGRSYAFSKPSHTELAFDQSKSRFTDPAPERWALDDRYPYDQKVDVVAHRSWQPRYPVSDLRLRAGIEPTAAGLTCTALLRARGHEFKAVIAPSGEAILAMRQTSTTPDPENAPGEFKTLASGRAPALDPGTVRNIEFWHTDQSLQLWVDGSLIVHAEYDWSPAERIEHATGRRLADLLASHQGTMGNVLADPSLYQRPDIRWVFEGAPFRLYRPAIDRDLFYQPAQYLASHTPALATSPMHTLLLNADQFFCCGDNSPASLDGRLWESVDPWVAQAYSPPAGIVPRDLMLGRAFFVYWPSLRYNATPVPVPDFGRMRFIW